jgi:hypothetical protein
MGYFMNIFKLDLLYILAIFLIAIFAPEAKAFTCVSTGAVGVNPKTTTLNVTVPCAAGTYAILAPSEMTQINTNANNISTLLIQNTITQNSFVSHANSINSLTTTSTALQSTTAAQSANITTLQSQNATYLTQITSLQNSVVTLNAAIVSLQAGSGTASPPFDGVLASFAMSFIVGGWLISKKAGLILSFIRGRRR